jgi:hypothetical protein
MALVNDPYNRNPLIYSVYNPRSNLIGTPLPPPPSAGDFELLDGSFFLLLDGTNFELL